MKEKSLLDWMLSCPCVIERRVLVDVRGPWPVAIVGLRARTIQTREDFVFFVGESL